MPNSRERTRDTHNTIIAHSSFLPSFLPPLSSSRLSSDRIWLRPIRHSFKPIPQLRAETLHTPRRFFIITPVIKWGDSLVFIFWSTKQRKHEWFFQPCIKWGDSRGLQALETNLLILCGRVCHACLSRRLVWHQKCRPETYNSALFPLAVYFG